MAAEYQLTFNDYLSIIRRRALLIVVTFVGLLAVVLIVAIVIPPVYQSTGTIMVESQLIPTELVSAQANSIVDERIEIIRQRVMTRENLLKIIDKYALFKEQEMFSWGKQSMTVSEKIDEMRKLITLESLSANIAARRQGQGTLAFKLSFDHRKPEVAHKVANELVTLFLDENVKSRTERANETTEFLTQEANKLQVELEKVEGQLATYKQEHSKALPQNQELRMTMLSRTEVELKDVERDYKAAQGELSFLDLELSAAKAGITPKTGAAYAAPQTPQDLGSLKAEYDRLKSLYTEAHPDVRAVKRKIEALEAAGATSGAGGADKTGAAVSIDVARVQTKIAVTQSRIDSLAAQVKSLRSRMASYEQEILQSPQVERGLITLMRDHENAQKKYEEIRAKQMNAKISENLEGENKAERFSLLEPPAYPEKPIKPDRNKIIAIGFVLALVGSGGLVALLETINQRVWGSEALINILHQRILATIPYITIEEELKRKRLWAKRLAISVVCTVILLLLALHFIYMPLDILLMKIMVRFG